MDNPQPESATASVDAWFKETTQALAEVRQLLLQIRDAQLARAVLPPEQIAAAYQQHQRQMAQNIAPYLDFRQPRLDGDAYRAVAYPGSPNAGGQGGEKTRSNE